uniref:Uncharacterized protein n=1 Tax=viral metagenome TaxID=1070528 RepID=A0A6M3JJQ9_9ZZZZ
MEYSEYLSTKGFELSLKNSSTINYNIMNIETPPSWRKGQTLFNFLEWLHTDKKYPKYQSKRTADTFNISDKELDELWNEYLILLGVEKNEKSKKK